MGCRTEASRSPRPGPRREVSKSACSQTTSSDDVARSGPGPAWITRSRRAAETFNDVDEQRGQESPIGVLRNRCNGSAQIAIRDALPQAATAELITGMPKLTRDLRVGEVGTREREGIRDPVP